MQVTKLIALAVFLLLAGCHTSSTYTEGTSLALGIYIPSSGQLYGVQALSWLSGCKVDMPTNQQFKISRTFQASNDYFGVVHIRERTKTEIEPKLDK